MIGDAKGYCILKSTDSVIGVPGKDTSPLSSLLKLPDDLPTEKENRKKLIGVPLRIIDIAVDGNGWLILEPKGNWICQVNDISKDAERYFYCYETCDVLLPPEYEHKSFIEQTSEAMKRFYRKGDYNDLVRKLVIMASLHCNKFYDDFLFDKQ